MDNDNVKKMVILIAVFTVSFAAGFMVSTLTQGNGSPDWAEDTADKLDTYGGSVYVDDGTYVRIYAHLKPTTHVEVKSGAFYITDPNNSHSGLVIIPLESVIKVYTGDGA